MKFQLIITEIYNNKKVHQQLLYNKIVLHYEKAFYFLITKLIHESGKKQVF